MRQRLLVGGLVSAVLAGIGCSGAPENPPTIGDDFVVVSNSEVDAAAEHTNAPLGDGECSAGDQRSCQIDLGVHAGIHDCVAGTQLCESGTWSRCYPN